MRREAATAGRRPRGTHPSGLLGRRLHPAARPRSAKVPGEDGHLAPSQAGRDANLLSVKPPPPPPPLLSSLVRPETEPQQWTFPLPPFLLAPGSEGRGAGRGGDRAAEWDLRAPWRQSSTGACCSAGAGAAQSTAFGFRPAGVRHPPGKNLHSSPELLCVCACACACVLVCVLK